MSIIRGKQHAKKMVTEPTCQKIPFNFNDTALRVPLFAMNEQTSSKDC